MDYKIASCIQSPAAWPQLPKSHPMKVIILVRIRSQTTLARRGRYVRGMENIGGGMVYRRNQLWGRFDLAVGWN